MTARVLACVIAIAGMAACGPKPRPAGVTADDAIFYIRTNVRDANVFVDGKFVGPAGILRGGIAVEPGKHRLELRHADYFSAYVDLDLARAERRKLELELAPVLP